MREELRASGVQDTVVDDAVLILSELLSNSYRHARPISARGAEDSVRAGWRIDAQGRLTVSVTDGGGPTRPIPATPSVTAHGGRGLAIIRSLSKDWGVRDRDGEVTVWAMLSLDDAFATRVERQLPPRLEPRAADASVDSRGDSLVEPASKSVPVLPAELALADFDDLA